MVGCHDQKTKFFLILKLSYVYCTYPYVHCWIHDMEQRVGGAGMGEEIILRICFSFVSWNCNLLQHDDEPLDGYLGTFCCPLLSIKWYGFDPKTKKGKVLEHQKNVKNVSIHQENNRKDQKRNHQFWLFSTSFNTISNVLNFLGVVSSVSYHSLTYILSTLPTPQLMSLVGCPQPSAEPIFTRHVLRTDI
jgi:hypothetical protein